MSQAHGYVAGRYRLVSRIATGGMGEVWRGTDTVLGRPVAVKVLRNMDAFGHGEATARFRAEARHVSSLSHPGIAQVYDFCDAENPPCLVMELVEGPSLAEVLASGPLDPARTMDIVAQTASALAEAHRAGVVHRDIKPGNLLLARGGQVKIIDFGIAQAAGSAATDSYVRSSGTVTVAGAVLGSPAYLAPERAMGEAAMPASDLYSLGIVAFECLAGRLPFEGTTLEVSWAQVHQPLPRLPGGVPGGVAALIEQLTAKNPAARPVSAGEVARQARQLRDGLLRSPTAQIPSVADLLPPVEPEPAGSHATLLQPQVPTGEPLDRRPRRRAGPAVAIATIAAVALAGLVGWQLRGALGAGTASHPPSTVAGGPTSGPSTSPSTIPVNAASLIGQPVWQVQRDLNRLGFQTQVNWVDAKQQPGDVQPGTVISVTPPSQWSPGAVVVLTAARGHGDHGNGNGNDGGGGGGG
jgi:eukaryotic-like serine/threonine-protein kinase